MIKIWYSFRKCYKLKLYFASHRSMPYRPRKQIPFLHHLQKNTTKGRIYVWSRNYFHNYILHTSVSSYRFPIPSSFFDVNQLEWINFESIFILLFCSFLSHKRTNSLSRRSLIGRTFTNNSFFLLTCVTQCQIYWLALMHHTSGIYTFLALFNILQQCAYLFSKHQFTENTTVNHCHDLIDYCAVCFCLFGIFRPTRKCFTRVETSPLSVKGCKFWPMLGNHRHWAVSVSNLLFQLDLHDSIDCLFVPTVMLLVDCTSWEYTSRCLIHKFRVRSNYIPLWLLPRL